MYIYTCTYFLDSITTNRYEFTLIGHTSCYIFSPVVEFWTISVRLSQPARLSKVVARKSCARFNIYIDRNDSISYSINMHKSESFCASRKRYDEFLNVCFDLRRIRTISIYVMCVLACVEVNKSHMKGGNY